MKLLLAFGLLLGVAIAQPFPGAADVDRATAEAIREGYIPGAVVVVGHQG